MVQPTDAAIAYQNHLTAAQALPAEAILPYRLDVDLALANVKTAMTYFTTIESTVPSYLPKEDLAALQSISELALAVKYAAIQVEQEIPSESEVSQKTAVGWSLRSILLSVAKGLAAAGLLPADQVAAIATGRGPRDMAEDAVQLAGLFQAHAATIAGKHAVTTDQVEQAAALGAFLLQHLRPKNAPAEKGVGHSALIDARNRLATLLSRRYARLQAVAHYLAGADWEDHVPALMSRTIKKSAPKVN